MRDAALRGAVQQALLVAIAGWLALASAMVEPSAFGTVPFSDETVASPQRVPGRVWLAWFDDGGAGRATHTYDDINHGSCELNPCEVGRWAG